MTELDGGNLRTISENGVPTGIAVAGDQLHFAGVEVGPETRLSSLRAQKHYLYLPKKNVNPKTPKAAEEIRCVFDDI